MSKLMLNNGSIKLIDFHFLNEFSWDIILRFKSNGNK
jgi:hypothetical protein